MQQEILHLKNAHVRRDGLYILDGVSLDIHKGEHVALLGPNGAGKSTLIDVIYRNVYPLALEDYEYRIFGQERILQTDLKKKVGLVSDRNAFFLESTYKVREIVCSGLYASLGFDFHHCIRSEDWDKADQELKKVGMYEKSDRMMKDLSSGEKRRVMLARATILEPPLLLLDEAGNALDFPLRRELREIIRKYAASSTIVMATHELSEILPEIDRIVLLKNGKIFKTGRKKDMLTEENLSELYGTRVYLSSQNGIYSAYC